MFDPGDPRHDEILGLANLAVRDRLRDGQRPRWRELVAQLLGNIRSEGGMAERRQHLRAPAELDVDILAPDEMVSLATSTLGAASRSLPIAKVIAAGTQMDRRINV